MLARQVEIGAQQRRERRQRLTVEIVNGGGEHEDGENPPAVAVRADGWVHWNSMVATSPAVARRVSALGRYSNGHMARLLNAASQLRLVGAGDDDLAGVDDQ